MHLRGIQLLIIKYEESDKWRENKKFLQVAVTLLK